MAAPLILGIESSCDETSVALVAGGSEIRCNLVASQVEIHAEYGGIVPEVASRHHMELLQPLVHQALDEAEVTPAEVDAVAVTCGPGLVGALLVGVGYAKALAAAWDRPLVGINHLEGHLYAPWMDGSPPVFPHVSLLVSGGHTCLFLVRAWGEYEPLGRTRDDAVGEAYDKVAKHLGLGYPGGPVMDRLAGEAEQEAFSLPRPMLDEEQLDFSFSGLKTAVMTALERANGAGETPEVARVARAFQEAAVDVLCGKALRAAQRHQCEVLTVSGGVAANRRLRERLTGDAAAAGVEVRLSPLALCGDNAAMIAGVAAEHHRCGRCSAPELGATARLPLASWRTAMDAG